MFRISEVSYKTGKGKAEKIVTETIYVNNADGLPSGACSILLMLQRDKDGKAIIHQNPSDGQKQYKVRIPGTNEMFANISVSAMTALKAMENRINYVGNDVWVKLDIKSLVPTMAEFNAGEPVKEI